MSAWNCRDCRDWWGWPNDCPKCREGRQNARTNNRPRAPDQREPQLAERSADRVEGMDDLAGEESKAEACPNCGGTGWQWLMPDGHKVECSGCDGSGEAPWVEKCKPVEIT